MATPACDASADREMKAVRFGYQDNSAADDVSDEVKCVQCVSAFPAAVCLPWPVPVVR